MLRPLFIGDYMNIYNEKGYLDFPNIRKLPFPFIFITGGRGTGKTYGALQDCILQNEKFVLMRRTQTEMDVLSTPNLNPFKKLNADHGWNYSVEKQGKYTGAIYEYSPDGTATGDAIGLTVALSTISRIRGFDASDASVLLYDEFIPESTARPIKDETSAFLNAYETINRNRELEGRPPLKCICMANSNRLDNPLFMGLGLVTKADEMKMKKQKICTLEKRGIVIINMEDSPISAAKQNTALYRAAAGTEFSQMALSNTFLGESERGYIESRPLNEYNPICAIGEICIYKHKRKREFYVSPHVSGSPPIYGTGTAERERFKKTWGFLWITYLENRMIFEKRICEILLTNYFK